jgi:single-strand DNA-binding protein
MASYNKVILIGNLCADPELRYLPKGTAVCQFNLAVNRKWRDESGQQKEEVAFIGVKAWGKQAELICQYVKKGRPLMVDGRLTQETWDDKTTNKKQSKTLVTLESFQFLGSNEGQSDRQPLRNATGLPANSANSPSDDLPPPAEDAVPF